MSNQSPRIPMQGIGAEQNPYSLRNVICALLILLSSAFTGWAQSPDTLSLTSLPHWVEYPTAPLAAGDTLEIGFHLGTAQQPISYAKGFHFEIQLSSKFMQEVCDPFSVEYSWLLVDGQSVDTSFMDPLGNGILHLQSSRTDTGSLSGYGELLRFKVVASEDIDNPSGLVSPSGGLVLVDNVEMKREFPIVNCPEWKLAPNPANEQVRVVSDDFAETSIQLLNLQGEVVESVQGTARELAAKAVQGLPEGLYLVRIRSKNGCEEVKKLIVKH